MGTKEKPINDTYLIETGKKDQERLLLLNDILNPYSISFIKKHVRPGNKVLEVGCGFGLMSQELAKIVGEKGSVLGTDLNEAQLVIARELKTDLVRNQLDFQPASVYHLSTLKGQYDVVYIRALLSHLDNIQKALEQIKAVLKPGGLLLVEEVAGNNTIGSDPQDARLRHVRKIDDVQEELQGSNFDIASNLGSILEKNGFIVFSDHQIRPLLDTLNKRRIFSLGMKSLTKAMIENNKFSSAEMQSMIKLVEEMEKDQSVKLYFYKMGQIAATFTPKL